LVGFTHDPRFSCFAAARTAVTDDGPAGVAGWFDAGRSFSNRMIDSGRQLERLLDRRRNHLRRLNHVDYAAGCQPANP
jgi:hypothetical protein